jgi:hypothetical protein
MDEFEEAREKIYESVRKELLGPGSEDIGPDIEYELITDEPITRYSTGILFPQKDEKKQEDDDIVDKMNHLRNDYDLYGGEGGHKLPCSSSGEHKGDQEEVNYSIEEKINMANELNPSSMGMTFFARGNLKKLNIRIKAAKYRKSTVKDCCVKYTGENLFLGNKLGDYVYRDGDLLKLKDNITSDVIKKFIDRDRYKEDNEYKKFISVIYALSRQYKDNCNRKDSYVREPLDFPEIISISMDKDYTTKDIEIPIKRKSLGNITAQLQICVVRRNYGDDINSYTIVLVNREGYKNYGRDLKSIFQPEIRISTLDNPEIKFVENGERNLSNSKYDLDKEEESLELLYRNKKNYAVGHGVSTGQNVDIVTGLGEIWTTFLPRYEVKKMDFDIEGLNKDKSQGILSMKNLSDISKLSKKDKVNNLNKIVALYDNWIEELDTEINTLDSKFKNAALRHMEQCKLASNRMKKGIELIEKDDNVYIAFSLMNRALLMQRLHSHLGERYPMTGNLPENLMKKFPEIDYENSSPDEATWRPFQIAYILMCIESIENPNCGYRDIVDLIWIPTGGGKTEAYLGLSAFTIFLRRLRHPQNGGGTTIIMRYTLRLLTSQQFIRASIMICACELIRREEKYNLGDEKITIGLWIGSKQTPNTKKDAKEKFSKLKSKAKNKFDLDYKKDNYNKFQLLKCPWCGTKLEKEFIHYSNKNKEEKEIEVGMWGYNFTGKSSRIFCPDEECPFSDENGGLPVQVVDECIYDIPPTLLFGTVDKFAMITWKERSSSLFALDVGNKNLSPELIIQDELHLISGPLGTIVGLYETAIDALCSEKGIRPKIIASTATIRRANEQCNQLYARDVIQFPSPGLDASDSFFTKDDNEKPGRLYVGVMPVGKTLTTAQVRLMSALTNRVKMMDIPEGVKDKYWTLVCYFNTLKELGMTQSLVQADIQDNINIVSNRLLRRKPTRKLFNVAELNSRKTASQINNTLKDLETNYSEGNMRNNKWAIDVVLASNMISVGLDVSRLNLMMVLQQPKLTSEYIQATSRVGREKPGIIFTLYGSSRTRDKSHYEMFYDYHQSFYKHVEPTSVTCFSEPARNRMLHSVFIALVRHILGLSSEKSASEFKKDLSGLDKVENIIVNRAEKLFSMDGESEDIKQNEIDDIKNEIYKIEDQWAGRVDDLPDDMSLMYSENKDQQFNLIKPFEKEGENKAMETLQSMRNVDKQSGVDILVFGDDEDE